MGKQKNLADVIFNIAMVYTGGAALVAFLFTIIFAVNGFNVGIAQGKQDHLEELNARIDSLEIAKTIANSNLNILAGMAVLYSCHKIKNKK